MLGVSNDANLETREVRIDPTTGRILVTTTISNSVVPGFNIPTYDYVSLSQTSTVDTYSFKSGGAGGTLVATITITYTDSTKATISTVAKT